METDVLLELGLPLVIDLSPLQVGRLEANRKNLRKKFDFYFIRAGKLVVTHRRDGIKLDCDNDFLIYL